MKLSHFIVGGMSLVLLSFTGCRTKSELRREQELEQLKTQVKEARDGKVDVETTVEELRAEIARLSGIVEQQSAQIQTLNEEFRGQMTTLSSRTQTLEQKQQAMLTPPPEPERPAESKRAGFANAKELFDEGKFEESVEAFRTLASSPTTNEETKKAQYFLGEACFAAKDYASAALEFAEFRKRFPKDPLVPSAIFKQASSFRNMGKKQEAKLFYQDLVDRYPASPFAVRAKAEMKKIK